MVVDSEGVLRCPATGQLLRETGGYLVTADEKHRYRIGPSGIPLFAEALCSDDGRRQQAHYDRIAKQYLAHLGLPHTRIYSAYLDRAFLSELETACLDNVAEICCGAGEAFQLLGTQVRRGVGIDISQAMLAAARQRLPQDNYLFAQGDATCLPLGAAQFDTVVMVGGIHHVNDRARLFSEVARILKPGGRFYWREPVSDFFLWRWLRAFVYRVSPALDSDTERPLLHEETVPPLQIAGLHLTSWHTYGFLGYCLLMNSDVLVFNRAFQYLPGIRTLTAWMTRLDDWMVRLPGLHNAGLQVIGSAEKRKGAA